MSFQEKKEIIINKINNTNLKEHKFNSQEINQFELFLENDIKNLFFNKEVNDSLKIGKIFCCNCGTNVDLHFDSGEIVIKDKCDFPFQNLEVEVDFSSGKIVNASYLVTIAEHISKKSSIGYSQTYKNIFLKLKHFAENKIFFPSIPNGQPSLYGENGNYTLVEGSNNEDEDIISWNGLKPIKESLGCFFIDYEKALKMKEAFDILEEDFEDFDDINELEIIEVPKGIYKCTIIKNAMYNRDHSDIFVVGTMNKIR
jgi:hypothetical protein